MNKEKINSKKQILLELSEKKRIVEKMNSFILHNDYENAEKTMKLHNREYSMDLEWNTACSILFFHKGDVISAVERLEKLYNRYEYNIELNYNLGFYHAYLKNHEKMLFYFSRVINSDVESVELYLEEIVNFIQQIGDDTSVCMEKIKTYMGVDNREYVYFPECNKKIDNQGTKKFYIGNAFDINGAMYACGVYDTYFKETIGYNVFEAYRNRYLFTTEIYKSEKCKKFYLECEEKCIVPVMSTVNRSEIEFTVNDATEVINRLVNDSFYYMGYNKGDKISIKSPNDIYVGNPIPLKHNKENKKLVITLFIDGLPQCMFTKENMPETYRKFKSEIIFDNAYSTAEWTLPSVAGIFTGKSSIKNRIYHPSKSTDNLKNFQQYTKILMDHGYMCTMIGGDWRVTPVFGYMKNMDRCLYRVAVYDFPDSVVVDKVIEHIETFGETDNYIWASLMDLHSVSDELEVPINCQVKLPFHMRNYEKMNKKSVYKDRSARKEEHLKVKIRQLDNLLHRLYQYLDYKYGNDYIISIVSDHGQGYLVPEDGELIDTQVSNIVMMMTGNDRKGKCDEIVQSIDFFPALLSRVGIYDNLADVQGKIPEIFGGKCGQREYAITESIFPNAPYYVSINDKEYKYFLQTKGNTTDDGMINIDEYDYKLIERITNKDVTNERKDICKNYTDIIFNHIKDYIVINTSPKEE